MNLLLTCNPSTSGFESVRIQSTNLAQPVVGCWQPNRPLVADWRDLVVVIYRRGGHQLPARRIGPARGVYTGRAMRGGASRGAGGVSADPSKWTADAPDGPSGSGSFNPVSWSATIQPMWGIHPSEWLHWLGALDWSQLNNVVSSIVGVLGLTGIAWATIKFGLNPLAAWLGRRRAQSKLLDQLACGSSVAYVESLFGAAQFITYENEREQRTYHLRSAWVMIEIADARVIAFSITADLLRHIVQVDTNGILTYDMGDNLAGLANSVHHNLAENSRVISALV